MFYIYFLYSEKYDRYYVGYSNDPKHRVVEHNTNPRMTYTHKFGPWILKKYYPVSDIRGEAVKLERFIKKQKSRRFIEQLIDDSSVFKDILQYVLK